MTSVMYEMRLGDDSLPSQSTFLPNGPHLFRPHDSGSSGRVAVPRVQTMIPHRSQTKDITPKPFLKRGSRIEPSHLNRRLKKVPQNAQNSGSTFESEYSPSGEHRKSSDRNRSSFSSSSSRPNTAKALTTQDSSRKNIDIQLIMKPSAKETKSHSNEMRTSSASSLKTKSNKFDYEDDDDWFAKLDKMDAALDEINEEEEDGNEGGAVLSEEEYWGISVKTPSYDPLGMSSVSISTNPNLGGLQNHRHRQIGIERDEFLALEKQTEEEGEDDEESDSLDDIYKSPSQQHYKAEKTWSSNMVDRMEASGGDNVMLGTLQGGSQLNDYEFAARIQSQHASLFNKPQSAAAHVVDRLSFTVCFPILIGACTTG